MYQYSLDSFVTFFVKSISKAKPADNVGGRVLNLRDALRMTIFTWVSRGLFERHKLIFLSQLAFNLMKRGILGEENVINEIHFQFLLRGPRKQVLLLALWSELIPQDRLVVFHRLCMIMQLTTGKWYPQVSITRFAPSD